MPEDAYAAPVVQTRCMLIFVKTLTGNTITLDVAMSDTIFKVEFAIQKKEGVPLLEQRLVVRGSQFDDGHTISDCNINHAPTLHLLVPLRGGVRSLRVVLPRARLPGKEKEQEEEEKGKEDDYDDIQVAHKTCWSELGVPYHDCW